MTNVELRAPQRSGKVSWEWIYFSVVMAIWCFSPFVRRVLDWRSGSYGSAQILSLLPMAALIPLAVVALRRDRLARVPRAFKIFALIWLGSMAYGALVGYGSGNGAAAPFEFVQYLAPVIGGLWLAGNDLAPGRATARATLIIVVVGCIVAVYGIVQFVQPPPWDVLWVTSANMLSVGDPAPMSLRIFSTLNSPGPCASFLAIVVLLCLSLIRLRSLWWTGSSAVLAVAALLLTLVRSAWVAAVVGLVAFLIVSPRRLSTLPFIVAFGLIVAALIPALPQMLGSAYTGSAIANRLTTFSDIDHDVSALTRQDEMAESFSVALANPIGTGLGVVGVASQLTPAGQAAGGITVLDSGYAARLLELGYLGFVGYLVVIIGSLCVLIRAALSPPRRVSVGRAVPLAIAICAALVWQDAAVDSHLGIEGIMFWIALGLGLREASDAQASDRWPRDVAPYGAAALGQRTADVASERPLAPVYPSTERCT